MLLSIVIVNWNTVDFTVACLRSLVSEGCAIDPAQYEVVVVDNASTDQSIATLRREFPWVHLIENRDNVGFARANNQAICASRGEFVLLLNPDTVVLPGALMALVACMTSHPGVGAAGSRLLNPDGSLQPSCAPAPTLARELWRLLHMDRLHAYGSYAMHRWPTDQPRNVDVVQGAALIVRRVVLEEVGLLDGDYFIYSEEVDLCQRIRAAGWQIYWVPQSSVVHYGGQSTRQVAEAMFQQLYVGKVLYFRKRHSDAAARAYKAVLALAVLIRLLLTPMALLGASPQRQQRLALAGNYWRLFRSLPDI